MPGGDGPRRGAPQTARVALVDELAHTNVPGSGRHGKRWQDVLGLLEHLRQHQPQVLWETTERIMAAVTAKPGTDVLLRRAARIASRVKAELDVVHVIIDDTSPSRDDPSIDELRELATDLGARWHEIDDDDPARALVSFAREHQITQIVTGSIQHSWWHIAEGGPILRRVIHDAGASGIDVHLIARRDLPPDAALDSSAAKEP